MDTKQTVHRPIEEEKKAEESVVSSTFHKSVSSKRFFSSKPPLPGTFAIILGVLVLLISSLLFYQQTSKPKIHPITIKTQLLVRRSMNLNEIKRSLTGKAIDVNTGKVVKAARIFSSRDDKTVYMELDLQNNKKGLVIDYIRYKGGRFVDHGEIILGKDNIQTVLFNWTINNLVSKLTEGQWKVATYTNGVLANRILYSVTSTGQVGYVTSQAVTPNAPDYNLSNALIASQKQ